MFPPSSAKTIFSPYRMKARFTREGYKQLANGHAPVYLRLTLGIAGSIGQRADIATGVTCTEKEWQPNAQRLKGKGADLEARNATLDMWLGKAKETYLRLKNEPGLTVQVLKEAVAGKRVAGMSLLALAEKFYANEARPALRKSVATLQTYRTRRGVLETYLRDALRQPGLAAEAVTLPWLRGFERWLVARGYVALTTGKHIRFVQMVVSFGAHEGILPFNPVVKYSCEAKSEIKDPVYLPEVEVQRLAKAVLPTRGLQDVADAWLFCAYTGMSYVEYFRFSPDQHLHTDAEGQQWIRIERQKKRWFTTAQVSIPVMPELLQLLERYQLHHLPKVSNVHFNRTLKLVSKVLNLSIPLEVGIARHTASHRYRNVYGFSDENAAAICGHSVQMMNGNYSRKREAGLKLDMKQMGLEAKPLTLLEQLQAALADPCAAPGLREQLAKLVGLPSLMPSLKTT